LQGVLPSILFPAWDYCYSRLGATLNETMKQPAPMSEGNGDIIRLTRQAVHTGYQSKLGLMAGRQEVL
jgi:hypothetical protein